MIPPWNKEDLQEMEFGQMIVSVARVHNLDLPLTESDPEAIKDTNQISKTQLQMKQLWPRLMLKLR